MNSSHKTDPHLPEKTDRRRLLCLAGTGVGAALGGFLCTTAQCAEAEKILKQGDKIKLGQKAEEIIEKAYKLGYDYEKKYGGCAQCTLAALQDAIPFVEIDKDLFRGAGCLDGGATPHGVQNCGGFTGSGMIIGYLCGRTRADKFTGSGKLSHQLIRKVYEKFEEHYGTVLCKDVRKGADKDCPKVVGRAAKWTTQVLLEEFTDYAPKKEEPKPGKKDTPKQEPKPSKKDAPK